MSLQFTKMPAKSYAAFPVHRPARASLALADTRSVVGSIKSAKSARWRRTKSVVSIPDVVQLPKAKRNFEDIFGKTGEYLHKLFIAEKQKDTIYEALVSTYHIGSQLSKEGPSSRKADDFFKSWENFANSLSSYYETSAIERLRAFVGSTISRIKKAINPLVLKDLTDNDAWVKDKQILTTGLDELKKLFHSEYIDEPAIQRTVYDLMNHSESSTNAFFRPTQMDFASQQEIVYQCHYRFTRIIDATYDYCDDEPLVRQVIKELNKFTNDLWQIFNPNRKKGIKYLDILTKKALSHNRRKSNLSKKGPMSRSQQMASVMRLSQVTSMGPSKPGSSEDASVFAKEDGTTFMTQKMMYLEKIDKLNLEIAELKKQNESLKTEIDEHMARKSLSPEGIEEARHRRYVTTYHQNVLIGDVIKFLKEHISQMESDVASLKSMNEELEEGEDTQTASFSNTKLIAEMKSLQTTLKKCNEDTAFAIKARDTTCRVNLDSATRDQIALAWRAIVFETEGMEDLNRETEACALALQTRIDQLRRDTTKRPTRKSSTTDNTKLLRDLLKKKEREMKGLRKLMEETEGNDVELSTVKEIDRYWISDETPAELEEAQERLLVSRKIRELVVARANKVQEKLLGSILESEVAQIRLLEVKREARFADVSEDWGINKSQWNEFEKQRRAGIDARARLGDVKAVCDAIYGGFSSARASESLRDVGDALGALRHKCHSA